MKMQKINHLAVWLIVLVAQLIPAGWYSLFQKPWMSYHELTEDFVRENQSATPFIVSIIASAILAYVLAWVYRRMQVESGLNGLVTGLLMGFAFTFLPIMVQNFFSYKPYALSWIDGGVNLIVWGVAGFILGAWRKYEG